MQPKRSQNAVKMQSKCSQNAFTSCSAYRPKSFQSCFTEFLLLFSVPDCNAVSTDQETITNLRQRLKTMKEIFGDEIDTTDTSKRKRAAKRRNGNCIDTIIDGSFMGMVLAICLTMVLGAAFFAYKNLYFAIMKKIYPDEL